jgi:mono/diheme cytochrome c family protein
VRATLVTALALIAPAAGAQDLAHGRALYETHCVQCHAERLHERGASKVRTLDDLREFVVRWSQGTRSNFTAQDIEDVVQHLNATHYRLKLVPRPPVARE